MIPTMNADIKLNFGKHNGKLLSECPREYLMWLAQAGVSRQNASTMAKQYLQAVGECRVHTPYYTQEEYKEVQRAMREQQDEEDDERFYQETKADAIKVLVAYRELQKTAPMGRRTFEAKGLDFAKQVLGNVFRDRPLHAYNVLCVIAGLPVDGMIPEYRRIAQEIK